MIEDKLMKSVLVFCVSMLLACAFLAGNANAATYVIEQSQSNILACYKKVYVPARIRVETRGKLVRPSSKGFDVVGDTWTYVRNPPVYIQKRTLIDADHYTLVPCD